MHLVYRCVKDRFVPGASVAGSARSQMGKLLDFAAASFIMVLIVATRMDSQHPSAGTFAIDAGTLFSASPATRRAELSRARVPASATAKIASDLQQAIEIIRNNYADGAGVDEDAVIKSAITSMLAQLDPHSSYFDAAEFRELLAEQDSEYSGTGSSIANFIKDGRVETYIIATHPDSAAAAAQLQFGDRMVAVNGIPIAGLTADIVRDKVRGPRGTTVRITVEHATTGTIETLEMRRDRVFQPSIPHFFMVRDGVGYVGISEGFSHTTSTELSAALEELRRRGMTSLVLDLRGNGGGVLEQAIKVVEKFLPAGSSIISQRGRYAFDTRTWKSTNRHPLDLPIVVLVDEQTASASEVVAGALQDNDRALIFGQNTFGKGLVQNVLELPMGSGLTLTTARYYTPSGRSLQRSYATTGLYDYFNHRSAQKGDESLAEESRTITNRIVRSGRGITPDEVTETERFSSIRAGLLDPIFFFVRDVMRGKVGKTAGDRVSSKDRVRQSIIFDGGPVAEDLLPAFQTYALDRGWKVSAVTLANESEFIKQQLRYQLALAAFGPETAAQSRIRGDKQVAKAINALPRAATLAAAATQVRLSAEKKKTRRVAFPTGQGRNRRRN